MRIIKPQFTHGEGATEPFGIGWNLEAEDSPRVKTQVGVVGVQLKFEATLEAVSFDESGNPKLNPLGFGRGKAALPLGH
jgi:hypothetical protein